MPLAASELLRSPTNSPPLQSATPLHGHRRTIHRRMINSSMEFLPASHPSRPPKWLPATSAALLTALTIGCASPAPPLTPSLNLPDPIKDLTAERIGNTVHLHWTTPTQTTSRVPVKGPLTAEICRTTAPPPPCSQTLRALPPTPPHPRPPRPLHRLRHPPRHPPLRPCPPPHLPHPAPQLPQSLR